ncbi:MAG TPA: hypothetical protein VKC56_09050 [Gallionellaceae bacterium]|nr:hypothetical protein [Gallionellaceae bacterium]
MGYDFHITRRDHWIDEGNEITAAEWLAYVERDSELQLLPDQGPYFTMWHGKCEYAEPWFDWKNGQIYTKNPDKAIVDKMVVMAREFAAKVQGDDGETCESGEQIDQPRPASRLPAQVRQWPSALRVAAGALGVVLAIAGIYLRYFGSVAWGQSAALMALLAAVLIFWLTDPERGKRKTLL